MSLTKVSYSMINGAPANILDYGADPTGIADSTSAIQACLNANLLGTIYIPEGQFKITSKLVIAGGAQNIVGEGRRSIIFALGLGSGEPMIENHGTTGNRRSGQMFTDFTLSTDDGNGIGFSLKFIERGIYKNISFFGLQQMVDVSDQCYLTLFESLRSIGTTGKAFSVIADAFNNNTFVNCTFGGSGFLLRSNTSSMLEFVGCSWEGCTYDATYPGAFTAFTNSSTAITGITGISFNGCYWENNNTRAINLDASGSSSPSNGIAGVSVVGCNFSGGANDVGHANATYAITAQNSKAITVTGNFFDDFSIALIYDVSGNGPWFVESNYIGVNSLNVERIPAFSNIGAYVNGAGGYAKNNGLLTRREYQGTAAPSTGTWKLGDIVWNNAPSAGAYEKFICVSAGTPGTWKGASLIQS